MNTRTFLLVAVLSKVKYLYICTLLMSLVKKGNKRIFKTFEFKKCLENQYLPKGTIANSISVKRGESEEGVKH